VIGWTGVRGVKALHLSNNYGMPTKLQVNHFSPPGVMNTGTSNPYLSPPPSTRARRMLPVPAGSYSSTVPAVGGVDSTRVTNSEQTEGGGAENGPPQRAPRSSDLKSQESSAPSPFGNISSRTGTN